MTRTHEIASFDRGDDANATAKAWADLLRLRI